MKIGELVSRPAREWKAVKGSELRKAYQQMKHAMSERAKTFAKHGEEARTMPSSRGLTEGQLRQEIKKASAYMRTDYSSYKSWKSASQKKLEDMQEALPELNLKTVNDLKQFGEFMNDMERKYAIIQYDSDEAKKIYQESMRKNKDPDEAARLFFEQGTRLGVSPNKFMRNYEYWKENADILKELTPIRKREGSRATKPSDYARQIEKIKKNRRGS